MGPRVHGLRGESSQVKREGKASADYLGVRPRKRGSRQSEVFPVYCLAGRGEASERSYVMRMAKLWCR